MRKTLKQFASLFLVLALVLAMVPAMGEPVEASGGYTLEFSPAAGTYSSAQSVTISGNRGEGTIYYTLDDTEPTMASAKYTGPISVTESTTIKAILYYSYNGEEPYVLSDPRVATAAYVINAPAGGTLTIGNDGYPYGSDMSASSVTLKIKIESGTPTSYQWQKSEASATEPSAFTDISGATSASYTFAPVDGAWYRCVVNSDSVSKAVQLITPNTSGDTYDRKWTCPRTDNPWYVSNGKMAYTVNGTVFDVTGYFNVSSGDFAGKYMLQTAYGVSHLAGWQMTSSVSTDGGGNTSMDQGGYDPASLDKVLFAFSDDDDFALTITADLESNQRSFSFGCDTQLGNGETSGDYCDAAALIAKQNSDNSLKYIAMIGAASESAATAADPAFVITPITAAPTFWIGYYEDREDFKFNTGSVQGYTMGSVSAANYSGTTGVVKCEGLDSGMTMSWLNVPAGGEVKFQFSVGSVANTGATGGSIPTSSSHRSTDTGTVTIPVSGDSGSVPVTASVNNGTATVQKPSDDQLDKILGEGVKTGEVNIDVSGLGKNITTANIPTETVKAVEEAVNDKNNDATAMTVILSDGQITLDGKALTAIVDQATGDDIRLNLDDVKITTLNTAQREAVNDLEVEVVLDAYITSNGQRISDFRGGKATVSVPYTLKDGQQAKGLVVWYVANDGTRTNMNAYYDGKNIVFVVPHFSNYVVAYDESLLQEKVSDCPKDSTCPISAFTDAKANAWYHDGVHWALDNNVMKGFNKTQFGPNDDTTRAQVATMIWRLAGSPAAKKAATFTDVASGLWYTDSIAWAAENGVVTGYTNRAGNLVFDPNGAVTREQLAAMIYRYAKLNGLGYKNIQTFQLGYPDASTVADWGFEPMAWLSEKGVINGIGGNLDPQAKASRAQVATMLMRFWSLEK